MGRKKSTIKEQAPYWHNEDISLFYEMEVNKNTIKAGDLVKVKHDRAIFRFNRLVVNSAKGTEWCDLYCISEGGWKSVRPDKIAGPYVAKRSRAKKVRGNE